MSEELHQFLGKAAAFYLNVHLSNNEIIGLTGGSTVYEIIQSISHSWNLNIKGMIVQMMGSVSRSVSNINPFNIMQDACERLNMEGKYLNAPGIVDTPEQREQIISDSSFIDVSNLWNNCTWAISGIGAAPFDPSAMINKEHVISESDVNCLINNNAIGDIMYHFFDIDGNEISCISNRIISINLDVLCNIPNVLFVSGGHNKVRSILGALRTGCVKILITDEETAEEILSISGTVNKSGPKLCKS
jgi:DNA-binding transcriptional regulator LsrR (DeoR family)